MSSRDKGEKKSKRRRRDSDDDVVRGSGVDYSKVADRHVDDERFEKHKQQGVATVGTGSSASSAPSVVDNQPKVSSQMAAVMRLMAGMEERTIAQKLADSNRPTWEQYKKDNEDKLDLVGADMKKMEAYRKELDEQREKLLTRGTNHKSNNDSGGKEGDKKSRKKKNSRKKHSRRHDDSYSSDSSDSSDNYDSNDDSRRDRKRKKHRKSSKSSKHDRKKSSRRNESSDSYESDEEDRKKSSKHSKREKKKKKKSRDGDSDSAGDDKDKYRLSSFFANGSDDESR
jgi:hypothetical protein